MQPSDSSGKFNRGKAAPSSRLSEAPLELFQDVSGRDSRTGKRKRGGGRGLWKEREREKQKSIWISPGSNFNGCNKSSQGIFPFRTEKGRNAELLIPSHKNLRNTNSESKKKKEKKCFPQTFSFFYSRTLNGKTVAPPPSGRKICLRALQKPNRKKFRPCPNIPVAGSSPGLLIKRP